MNIKSISNQLDIIKPEGTAESKDVRSESSSSDKEGNGKREDQHDQDQSALNEEEHKAALEYLNGIQNLKDNGFVVSETSINERNFFIIKDQSGNIIRKIPDYELRFLAKNSSKEKKSGQILNKAM